MAELKVSLVPHVGQQRYHMGGEEIVFQIPFDQCFVQCNGRRVGIYCGKSDQPNKYLSFTEPLPQPLQEQIAKEVAKLTGGVGKFNAPPPDEHEVADDE